MIGEHLGPYRVLCRLGKGGMGEVFQAQREDDEQAVAIKVLHGEFAADDPELIRFSRETQVLGELEHPGIVRALTPLTVLPGQAYYAMEFVAGRDLSRLLKDEGALAPARALRLASEVLDALAFAHQHGVVHRDVKPSNVLLDAAERVRLADFGLARVAGHSSLTRTGTVMGTPEYMAPEQARGQDADARADLYAVGVMLYEMLSGRPPFRAEQPLAVLRMHLDDPVPPLEAPQPLPAGLEGVVRRALAKRPQERWPDAASMLAALRSLDPEAETAPLPSLASAEAETAALPGALTDPAPAGDAGARAPDATASTPGAQATASSPGASAATPDAAAGVAPPAPPRRRGSWALWAALLLGAPFALWLAAWPRLTVKQPQVDASSPAPTTSPSEAASPQASPRPRRVQVQLKAGGTLEGPLLELNPLNDLIVVDTPQGPRRLSFSEVAEYRYLDE